MLARQRWSEVVRQEQLKFGEARAVGIDKARTVGRDREVRETQKQNQRDKWHSRPMLIRQSEIHTSRKEEKSGATVA